MLAASVVGPAALDGDVLHVTGETPTLDFGGGAVTLVHDAAEDQLSCSGRIQATDLFVEVDGTMMSVAALLRKVARMEEKLEAMKRFAGWVPPSAPPPYLPPVSPPPMTCTYNVTTRQHGPGDNTGRYTMVQFSSTDTSLVAASFLLNCVGMSESFASISPDVAASTSAKASSCQARYRLDVWVLRLASNNEVLGRLHCCNNLNEVVQITKACNTSSVVPATHWDVHPRGTNVLLLG